MGERLGGRATSLSQAGYALQNGVYMLPSVNVVKRFGQDDLTRQYWLRVFEPCLSMWEKGFTPNPDIWCNK